MPDIPLLTPLVLQGVIEKFTAAPELIMMNRIPRTPYPYPTATWDVIKGSRMVAKPNVPNSEAHIVPRLGRSQMSASFVYFREKKVFEPTTVHWLRAPGEIAASRAEQAVLREVQDLDQRFNLFMEWCIWRMFTGVLTLDYPDVQATIDYQVPASHKISAPSAAWSTATIQQIRDDITAWKRLIRRDSRGVPARDVFLTEPTLNTIIRAATTGSGTGGQTLLTDAQKQTWWDTGTLTGFLGLTWNTVEDVYMTDAGVDTLFVPDGALLMGNFDMNRPFELFEGPTADDDAPEGFTGKFTKTWKEKDPSARQFLEEWHALPVLTRPEQFVYVTNVG